MKRTALALALAAATMASPAVSQTAADERKNGAKPAIVLAIVDGTKLSQAAKAMKAAQEEAEKLARRFEADFTAQENKLKQEYEQLQKDRAKITGDDYDRRLQRLTQRAGENRRTAQIRQQQMALAVRQVQVKFREEVVTVVKAIAVEDGFTVVVDKAAALHVSPQFDITDKVLARIDQSATAVKFEFPPKAEPGTNSEATPATEGDTPAVKTPEVRKPPAPPVPAAPPKKTN